MCDELEGVKLQAAHTGQQQLTEAVRESEARYRTLFEATTEAVFLETLDGRVLDCNTAASQILGYSKEELLGLSVADLVSAETAAMLPDLIAAVKASGGFSVEAVNRRKNGETFPVQVSARLVTLDGEPKVIVCVRDITAHKRAEKMQAALYRISEAAHAAQDLQALFCAIHAIIGELMPARNFYIALYDAEAELLSFPYFVDEFETTPQPKKPGRGLTEYVLRRGEPLLASPDLFERLVAGGQVELIGTPSIDWLGVPLKTEDRTIGVLAVQNYSPGVRFTEQDLGILSFVSDQVAMAIERKQAEAALRESEELYRTLVQTLPNAVMTTDLEGRITFVSPRTLDLHGFVRADELLDRNLLELIAPEDRKRAAADLQRTLVQRGVRNIEYTLLRQDGTRFIGQLNTALITDVQGQARAFIITTADITGQKQAEQQIEERRVYLESVLACAPDAIVTTDAQHRVLEWNLGAERLFGYTAAEARGRDLDDLIATPNATMFEQARRFTRHILGRQFLPPTETVRYSKDGTPRDVVVSGAPILVGDQGIGVVAAYTDISERKRAEEALQRRDAILEAVSSAAGQLLKAASWEEDIQEVLERLGQATQASRVYLFENHTAADGTLLTSQRYEWAAPGIRPQIDNPDLQDFPYLAGGFERWVAMLGRGQPIYGQVRDFPAGEQPILAAQEIRSIAIMPIFVGQEWWGFIGFDECRAEREWSVAELDALRTAADILGTAIQRQQAEEELRRVKEFNESIVRNMAEGIVVQDANFDFTFVNPAAAALLGYTPDELSGRHWTLVVPPDQQPIIQAADRRRMHGAADRYQVELLCKDGSRVPVLISGSPRFDPTTGRFVGTMAVFTDISEQVQAEAQLARYARQMGALYETSLEIGSQPDLSTLLRAIVQRAAGLVGVRMGGLYLVRPGGQELELVVSHNLPHDYTGTRLQIGEGLSGRILQTGEPITVPDYQAWEGRAAAYAGVPFRRVLGVPLKVKGRVIGAINVADEVKTGEFSPDEVQLVHLFADQAAIAIENARLLEAEAHRRREAETLWAATQALTSTLDLQQVFELILRELRQVVPHDSVSVQQLKGDRLEIIGGSGFPNLDDLLGVSFDLTATDNPNQEVIRTRAPVILSDAPAAYDEFKRPPHDQAHIRSWLGVPLLFGDRLIGMIALDKQEPGFFTEEHARMALAFAAQAAIAIENARLFHETQRRAEHMATLNRIGLAITAGLDLGEVLQALYEQLSRIMDVGAFYVALYDEETGIIDFPLLTGRDGQIQIRPQHIHRQPGLTGYVIRSRQPLYLPDIWAIPPEAPYQAIKLTELSTRSYIGVPLQYRDRVIGVLSVQSYEPDAYTEADLQLVTTIATQAAVAIENARLFQAEHEQREMAEALHRAAAAVSSTLDLDEILDHILEQAGRVIPNDAVNIGLIEEGEVRIVRWRGYERFGQEIRLVRLPLANTPSLQQMYRTGRPQVIPDTENYPGWVQGPEVGWVRSYAGAPIRVRDRVIGFLNADSATPNFYRQEHADRLCAFADQVSLALANAELFRMVAQDRRDWEVTFDAMQDAVAVVDHHSRIVRANQAFADLVHRPLPQIVGQQVHTILAGMSCTQPPCLLEPAREGGRVATCIHEYHHQTLEVQVTPVAGEGTGGPHPATRAIYVLRDITGRIQAEESRRRLSTAVEQAAEAVMITGTDGLIVYVNPAFERIIGYSRAEVVGHHLTTGGLDTILHGQLRATMTAGREWQGRVRNVRRDGRPYTLDITVTPVRNAAGEIVNYVATMRDVTREVQLEQQFFQAQKMEALGQLAGGVAHDFNNLLTVIHLSTRLLRRQLHPEDPLWEHVVRIEEAGERAAHLTRQLLSFSRREVVEPRVINLNQIVGDLSRMLQRIIGENIELKTILAQDLYPIKADPSQIDQVILNLAVNARDAMPQGGTLTIETSNLFLDQTYVASHVDARPGPHVLLSISDTGVGMSDEVKAHLFEPFFTTKEQGQGTGLGLATVFGIVKQNGGHIHAYSEVGQGTTFKIYLPCTQEGEGQPSADIRPLVADSLVRGTETVLVVEDKEEVRDLAVQVLSLCGYRVLAASSGPEALQLSGQHPGPIHLLLTDVVMPRMTGKELADRLRAQRPRLRVLYMSGYADNAIIENGTLALGTAFLSKPFTVEGLTQKVRAVLDGRV